jgi:hypothetical protein
VRVSAAGRKGCQVQLARPPRCGWLHPLAVGDYTLRLHLPRCGAVPCAASLANARASSSRLASRPARRASRPSTVPTAAPRLRHRAGPRRPARHRWARAPRGSPLRICLARGLPVPRLSLPNSILGQRSTRLPLRWPLAATLRCLHPLRNHTRFGKKRAQLYSRSVGLCVTTVHEVTSQ